MQCVRHMNSNITYLLDYYITILDILYLFTIYIFHIILYVLYLIYQQCFQASDYTRVIQEVMRTHPLLRNEYRPSFEIRPVNKCVYVYCACVISRSSNYGSRFKEDLIRQTKLNMAAKFVEKFIFHRGIGERNDVQNLKFTFIYINNRWFVFIIP